MKILTVVGARPQFIKAAPVSRELRKFHNEVLVHTGQHYDKNMSEIFFQELGIPRPDYNLEVGSGSHGKQTGNMLIKIEEVILHEKPDALLVYGDTNSTFAGALAASKVHVPVIHIEAGLRSFNMRMPEEQNRILTDHISTLLFCPTGTAVKHLENEGITKGVFNVGDVMYDTVLYNIKLAEEKQGFEEYLKNLKVLSDMTEPQGIYSKLAKDSYYLVTIHRAENTDNEAKIKCIFDTLERLDLPVILPLHPRTKKILEKLYHNRFKNIFIVEPVGYLEMLVLTKNAQKVLTDSGGLQKEAYFLKTPCVTLRDQTEWVETLHGNWNVLTGIEGKEIMDKIYNVSVDNEAQNNHYFGRGNAAELIVEKI